MWIAACCAVAHRESSGSRFVQHQNGLSRKCDFGLVSDLGELEERIVERIHVKRARTQLELDTDDRAEERDILYYTFNHVGLFSIRSKAEPLRPQRNLDILAACLLAELCPFDRFFEGTALDRKTGRPRAKNARDAEASLAKWVGLWWPRNQSGTFEGEITRMPKDGNRYARYALIQLANCLREHSAEFAAYYSRKHAESKTHAHKRALVLSARKAIGLIVALLHTGQLYRTPEPYREVLSPHLARGQAAASSPAATDPCS